jgi:NAD(P)-dependent dehydrogenase (short-subunit alcohol dehydrogenase family)
MRSYQTAKLAMTTWTYRLARRWEGRVTANVLDPGIVKGQSGEQYEGPASMRVLMSHVIPFFVAKSMERGPQQYYGWPRILNSRVSLVVLRGCTSCRAGQGRSAAPR